MRVSVLSEPADLFFLTHRELAALVSAASSDAPAAPAAPFAPPARRAPPRAPTLAELGRLIALRRLAMRVATSRTAPRGLVFPEVCSQAPPFHWEVRRVGVGCTSNQSNKDTHPANSHETSTLIKRIPTESGHEPFSFSRSYWPAARETALATTYCERREHMYECSTSGASWAYCVMVIAVHALVARGALPAAEFRCSRAPSIHRRTVGALRRLHHHHSGTCSCPLRHRTKCAQWRW